MSDSIKVASMVASLSANTAEFETGMKRAAMVAETQFAKISRITDGGFKEGLRVKGIESRAALKYNSLADILGDNTEKKVAEAVATAATSAKVKQAATVTASTFGERLSMAMSDKNLFTGIQKFAKSGDAFSAAGGIGLALGGWSVAIGAAVEGLRAIAPIMDEILWGTNANAEAAAKYAKSVQDAATASETLYRQQTLGIASGAIKPPDWLDEFVNSGGDERFWNNPDMVVGTTERINNEIARLRGEMAKMGRRADYVAPGKTEEEEAALGREFDQMQANLQNKINQLQDRLNRDRIARLRTPMDFAAGAAAGAFDAGQFGNFAESADAAGGALGNFVQRYFKEQQQLAGGNPFADFQKENERISKNLADGVINEQQANIQRGRARQALDSAMPMVQPQFASLVRANSAEASRAILASMLPKVKPEDRPLKDLKNEAEKQTKQLERIGNNTAKEFKVVNF